MSGEEVRCSEGRVEDDVDRCVDGPKAQFSER